MSGQRPDHQQLNAFIDGELDLQRQLELESAMSTDEALRAQATQLTSLRDAVKREAEYHRAPESLRLRIAQVTQAPLPAAVPKNAAPSGTRRPSSRGLALLLPRRVQALGAGLAMAMLFGWALIATPWRPGADELVLHDVVASHVRSTLGNRLIDVASSDQHTVKPWLSSRLDYSPPIAEPAAEGATLAGARVDYVNGRPVAAVVYRQHQHVIDLFVWPTAARDAAARVESLNGFHAAHAVHGGMDYWAVSDINGEELLALLAAQTRGEGASRDR
jgi:anti-sigma factor RsiW